MITGNIEGIRNTILDKLEAIYEINTNKNYNLNMEMIDILCYVTDIINREISVAIDRRGNVINVSIGDNSTVEIASVDIKDRKLSGVAVIHTHPKGNSRLSLLDISALGRQKLDYIAALGVENGKCREISFGFCIVQDEQLKAKVIGPITVEAALNLDIRSEILQSEESIKGYENVQDDCERALLVGIDSQESIEELRELAKACNVKTMDMVIQNKEKVDTAFYVGRGKIDEISYLVQLHKANVVIFDDELSASQIRNVEDALGVKVIDRTTLILEIFARRARTKEAKIQVELAQLKYRLPRLIGMGGVLSRTGGGIGTRGPGEKKLETDKRHIRERIYDLKRELVKIKETRKTQREKREKENIPKVALVGYTNAGKSTLRNKICQIYAPNEAMDKEKVFEANMLFATLDTTIRAIELEDSRIVTFTDTVGFISKLPHDLVEAFKSTLEEVIYSDLLLHVVDSSSPSAIDQINVVNEVLKELNAQDKPSILVLNKIDAADKEAVEKIKEKFADENFIDISAKEGLNIDVLMKKIQEYLPNNMLQGKFLIPYDKQNIVAYIHQNGKINMEEYKEEGTYIEAIVDKKIYNKCKEFLL
ncbi:GTPase HflX [Haloimpatiens lingqiaonensis]|uniref:GTPase HflX n=1 Tax=Haloimpatiens lingqiaonensis TaxID=1380675 RepID=UPI0010FE0226|nr:GTPase HflX [Haloimpatiens lingqiaonensis]